MKHEIDPPAIIRADVDLKTLAGRIVARHERSLIDMRDNGLDLATAQKRCQERGIGWGKWLTENVGMTRMHAWRLIELASRSCNTVLQLAQAWEEICGRTSKDEPDGPPPAPPPSNDTPSRADEADAWDQPEPMFRDDGEPQGMWNVPDPAADPAPQRPAPELSKYPYSERIVRWLERVSAEPDYIRSQLGGFKAICAERGKWNKKEVREVIVPVLESLERTLKELREEIERCA